jgi:hypothetical protein
MRWLLIIPWILFCLPLSYDIAHAAEQCDYISLRSVNDKNDAVRFIKETDYFKVGVFGDREFTLQIIDSYPDQINEQWIFLSTGETLPVIDGLTSYTCSYLMLYFGLAVSSHQDGSISTIPFWITPAWHPKDKDRIPSENPEPVRPIAEDQHIDSVISSWWITEVEPYLKLHEPGAISDNADASP